MDRLSLTVDEERMADLDESLPPSQRWVRRGTDDPFFSTDTTSVGDQEEVVEPDKDLKQKDVACGTKWFIQVIMAQAKFSGPS